jgi:hypothetical protein
MWQDLPITDGMGANAFVSCLMLGAAVLAFWLLVRFEGVGPRSMVGAICGWASAGALIIWLPALNSSLFASGIPQPRIVMVFGLVLPVFTYFFLTGAWFMRTLLSVATSLR